MRATLTLLALLAVCALGWPERSPAQTTVSEDFTQTTTTNKWYYYNGACLTAGSGAVSGNGPGIVPGCTAVWTSYYTSGTGTGARAGALAGISSLWDYQLVGGYNGVAPSSTCTEPLLTANPSIYCSTTPATFTDPAGNGALRFTNGYPYGFLDSGAIVSSFTFNAGTGLHMIFKTVTYRGDQGSAACGSYDQCSGSNVGDGAEGISFYLIDATSHSPGDGTYNGIGSWGGSIGYSCSNGNSPYDGLVGGYIGVGINEYGDFINASDNTATGFGLQPSSIGIRGNGTISWNWLHANYPQYYPTSALTTPVTFNGQSHTAAEAAVGQTCKTGYLWDYSNPSAPVQVSPAVAVPDYAAIKYVTLPSNVQIANETAWSRGAATPIAYDLSITQNGYLSLSYSYNGAAYQPVVSAQNISGTNGALPATLRFGFAGTNGGHTNVHELLCFRAEPVNASSSSSSTDQQQVGQLETTSQAYFAYYNANNWTGRLTAYGLTTNSSTHVLTVNSTANWDSQCTLTGVSNLPLTGTQTSPVCPTTSLTTPANAQPITDGTTGARVMLTWNDVTASGAGVAFEWPGSAASSNLTSAEQTALDAGDTTATAKRLNYLRGDRGNEINSLGVGLYRRRDGVLGDIVDSSPVFVGPPSSPYALTWHDRFVATDATPENSGTSYANFLSTNQSRLNVVYVGANDGFLHGFRSGSEDSSGNVIDNTTTPNDGAEVIAYMPAVVNTTIHNSTTGSVDYSNALYGHNFYVDATPGTGDLFYNGAWHTWLVGGLGAGGADIYALDITDPSTTSFNENKASSVVIGDWTSSTISCSNVSSCGTKLGNTYGTPLIRRLHNGMWGVIFGNGFGSSSGDAGIFVMTVNQSTAAKTFYYLSTGVGSTTSPNGIAYVTAADLDGDHITDYVYAGDLQGNVWRFDLTACLPTAGSSGSCTGSTGWAVTPGPLFQTQSGQPITTPVVLASAVVVGKAPALIVSFGTGQRTAFTNSTPAAYSAATQSLYGVWDWNFSTWNASASSLYASLTAAQMATASGLSSPYTLTASKLQAQTYTTSTISGTTTIETSNTTVNWKTCAATCTGSSFGWYANLPGSQGTGSYEQLVSPPILFQQGLILNTTLPAVNNPLSCLTVVDQGNTYIINVVNGGTFTSTGTTTKVSGFLTNSDVNTVGQNLNETGAMSVVNNGTNSYLIGQYNNPNTGSAPGNATAFKLPTNITASRVTWTQLR